MNIIFILIPIAMLFVTIAVILFFWAVRTNQFDDLDREGQNILFDEEITLHNKNSDHKIKEEVADDQ